MNENQEILESLESEEWTSTFDIPILEETKEILLTELEALSFPLFVERLEKFRNLHDDAVVKCIFPPSYIPNRVSYEKLAPKKFKLTKQIVTKEYYKGTYWLVNHATKEYSNSKDLLRQLKPPSTVLEYEENYWKDLGEGTKDVYYGLDVNDSYYESDFKYFSPKNIDSVLKRVLTEKIPGITEPYLYFGFENSSFAWHVEDLRLFSLNYLHFGAPKIWYSVPRSQTPKFSSLIDELYPYIQPSPSLPSLLSHKQQIIHPSLLLAHGLKVMRTVQSPGEMIVSFPNGLHSGFNAGSNCAESVNFGSRAWLEEVGQIEKVMNGEGKGEKNKGVKGKKPIFCLKRFRKEFYRPEQEGEVEEKDAEIGELLSKYAKKEFAQAQNSSKSDENVSDLTTHSLIETYKILKEVVSTNTDLESSNVQPSEEKVLKEMDKILTPKSKSKKDEKKVELITQIDSSNDKKSKLCQKFPFLLDLDELCVEAIGKTESDSEIENEVDFETGLQSESNFESNSQNQDEILAEISKNDLEEGEIEDTTQEKSFNLNGVATTKISPKITKEVINHEPHLNRNKNPSILETKTEAVEKKSNITNSNSKELKNDNISSSSPEITEKKYEPSKLIVKVVPEKRRTEKESERKNQKSLSKNSPQISRNVTQNYDDEWRDTPSPVKIKTDRPPSSPSSWTTEEDKELSPFSQPEPKIYTNFNDLRQKYVNRRERQIEGSRPNRNRTFGPKCPDLRDKIQKRTTTSLDFQYAQKWLTSSHLRINLERRHTTGSSYVSPSRKRFLERNFKNRHSEHDDTRIISAKKRKISSSSSSSPTPEKIHRNSIYEPQPSYVHQSQRQSVNICPEYSRHSRNFEPHFSRDTKSGSRKSVSENIDSMKRRGSSSRSRSKFSQSDADSFRSSKIGNYRKSYEKNISLSKSPSSKRENRAYRRKH